MHNGLSYLETKTSFEVWKSVQNLINAGTPMDGLKMIVDLNVNYLKEELEKNNVLRTENARGKG